MSHPYPHAATKVIHVKGTDRAIGSQHAEQVGESVSKGMVKFYLDFWRRILSTRPEGKIGAVLHHLGRFLLEDVMQNRLRASIPEHYQDRVRGIAEATGRSFEDMLTILVLPDLLPILQAYLARVRPRLFLEVSPPPRFGCSSFISAGHWFLHGRNLDFPGVAYWDRYPVIQATTRHGDLRYLGFTTAGVPIAGITGVNEAQISVSLHQHYCLETSLKGVLPFVIAEEILAKARSLSDATAILKRSRVASSWAFLITDGKKRDAFIYETHPKASGIRYLKENGGVLSHSNYFQTEACRPAEYATTSRMNWDNYWRKTRLEQLVVTAGNHVSPEQGIQFLSDHYDSYWEEEKIINRTVSQVYNIQSVLLDVENMKAWLAEGPAPVHLREYREYDLGAIFEGQQGDMGRTYPAYCFKDPRKKLAKEAYILSFISAFDGDLTGARRDLSRSMEADYCAEAGLVDGVLAMKAGDFKTGVSRLLTAKEWIEDRAKERARAKLPPEYFEICLQLARAYDLSEKRSDAITLYRWVAAHGDLEDKNLRAIALQEGPYTAKKLNRILMPYSSYIPFE